MRLHRSKQEFIYSGIVRNFYVKIETLIGLVIILLMSTLTAYVAWKRGRNPTFWFLIGLFFGWLGFLVVYFLPKQEEVLKQRGEEVSGVRKKEAPEPVAEPITLEIEPIQNVVSEEACWYYLDKAHAQQGPLAALTLEELWKKQEIVSKTFVWKEGMSDWKRIEDLSDLFHSLQQSTAQ